MKNIAKSIILATTVAALAALLLAGCQRSDQKKPAQTLIQSGKDQTNSLKRTRWKPSMSKCCGGMCCMGGGADGRFCFELR